MDASEQFSNEFIAAFRRNPCLWDKDSPISHNLQLKKKAHEELFNLLKENDDEATWSDCLTKIAKLKTFFKREHAKFLKSLECGPIYKPTSNLYYSLLILCPAAERQDVVKHLKVNETVFNMSQEDGHKKEIFLIDYICLGCTSKDNLIDIYTEPVLFKNHQTNLAKCFDIHIKPEQGFGFLCVECAHHLLMAMKFKVRLQNSIRLLVTTKYSHQNKTEEDVKKTLSDMGVPSLEEIRAASKDKKKVTRAMRRAQAKEARQNKKMETESYIAKKKRVLDMIKPEDVTCPICGCTCRSNFDLRVHCAVHYSQYICDLCGKVATSRDTLVTHMSSHSEPLKCTMCEKTFKNRVTLNSHMNVIHMDKRKTYKCKQCEEKFDSYIKKKKHEVEMHNASYEHFCRYCSKPFLCASERSRHERRYHLQEREQKCDHCGESFWNITILKRHLMTAHNVGERVSCPHCPKTFVRAYDRNVHAKTHYGSYKYKCVFCDKKFNRPKDMRSHLEVHRKQGSDVNIPPPQYVEIPPPVDESMLKHQQEQVEYLFAQTL